MEDISLHYYFFFYFFLMKSIWQLQGNGPLGIFPSQRSIIVNSSRNSNAVSICSSAARKVELSTDIKTQAAETANAISCPYLVASNLIVQPFTFKTETIHHHGMGIHLQKNEQKNFENNLLGICWRYLTTLSSPFVLMCSIL